MAEHLPVGKSKLRGLVTRDDVADAHESFQAAVIAVEWGWIIIKSLL